MLLLSSAAALPLLRPFSGAFHVGGSFFVFPSSRAFRGGKGVLRQVIGSVAAGFGSVAATPLRCLLPLLVARLLSSRWKGPAGAEKRKWCCHYYPSPFGCLRPVGTVGQDGRGRYCLFATFSSSPSPSPVPPFREPPLGRKRGVATGLAEAFPLLPFATSPSSPSRRTSPGGVKGRCVVAGLLCGRTPSVVGSCTLSVAGFLVWAERRLFCRVCRVGAGSLYCCCRRLLSGRKNGFCRR